MEPQSRGWPSKHGDIGVMSPGAMGHGGHGGGMGPWGAMQLGGASRAIEAWGPWRQEPWGHGGMGPWGAMGVEGHGGWVERGGAGMHWGPLKSFDSFDWGLEA